MNLRAFHIVFVTCSTILAIVIGGWSFRRASEAGAGYLVMGVLSIVAAIVLVVYGVWFWRKIRTPEQERERRRRLMSIASGIVALVLFSLPDTAEACEVCFGAADNAMIDGARGGVLLLLGLLFCVQAGFVAFFLYLKRRASKFGPQNIEPWWNTIEEPVKR